jgi:2-C-methyl-D-erythritol 2,4-cyclodiphosphate synthase
MHFPDTDARYKDASSLWLLGQTARLLSRYAYEIENIDATVIAQAPRLAPHREAMAANIARALSLPSTVVNVKATTEEGLGFTGAGQGIASQAVCLIKKAGLPCV